MGKPRVLLGDGRRMFLQGLDRLLSTNYDVVATAADGREVLKAAVALSPDVIVVDLNLPSLNGLELSRRLLVKNQSSRIIILSRHADIHIAAAALAAGVKGFLVKEETVEALEESIDSAMRGGRVVSEVLDQELLAQLLSDLDRRTSPATFELTTRQKQVLPLLAEGLGLKEVGARLGISVKTVEFHKYGLMERLGARTSAELVRYALVLGLE
ncbi:MAG: response regulator transcription factor [Acidobacteriota bacterium]